MLDAAAGLRAAQIDDRFEIIPRPRPPNPSLQEWRVRCLDCPGKVSPAWRVDRLLPRSERSLCPDFRSVAQLYNLGPGETLSNFSVHFKNRQHLANVETRLKAERDGPA